MVSHDINFAVNNASKILHLKRTSNSSEIQKIMLTVK